MVNSKKSLAQVSERAIIFVQNFSELLNRANLDRHWREENLASFITDLLMTFFKTPILPTKASFFFVLMLITEVMGTL